MTTDWNEIERRNFAAASHHLAALADVFAALAAPEHTGDSLPNDDLPQAPRRRRRAAEAPQVAQIEPLSPPIAGMGRRPKMTVVEFAKRWSGHKRFRTQLYNRWHCRLRHAEDTERRAPPSRRDKAAANRIAVEQGVRKEAVEVVSHLFFQRAGRLPEPHRFGGRDYRVMASIAGALDKASGPDEADAVLGRFVPRKRRAVQ